MSSRLHEATKDVEVDGNDDVEQRQEQEQVGGDEDEEAERRLQRDSTLGDP